jgi:hypothetical protein
LLFRIWVDINEDLLKKKKKKKRGKAEEVERSSGRKARERRVNWTWTSPLPGYRDMLLWRQP